MLIPAGLPLRGLGGDLCLCVHTCVQTRTERNQFHTMSGMFRVVGG